MPPTAANANPAPFALHPDGETADAPALLAEALRLLSAGRPTWVVRGQEVVWANDEAAAWLAERAPRDASASPPVGVDGLEVRPLGPGGCVLLRAGPDLGHRLSIAAARWGLTPGQARVLEPVVRGLSNKEVAAALGVEEATVEAHVGALFRKSGTTGRAAMLFAFWTTTEV
jgi:DNA-binding NarL/FixJ family response regulator